MAREYDGYVEYRIHATRWMRGEQGKHGSLHIDTLASPLRLSEPYESIMASSLARSL